MKVIVRKFSTDQFSNKSLIDLLMRLCNTSNPNEDSRLLRSTKLGIANLFSDKIKLENRYYSPSYLYNIIKPYDSIAKGINRSMIINNADNFEFNKLFYSDDKNDSIRSKYIDTFELIDKALKFNNAKREQLCQPVPFYITNLIALSILNNRDDYRYLLNLRLENYKYQIFDKIVHYYNHGLYDKIPIDEYVVSKLNI